MQLPVNEHVFDFKQDGSTTGQEYQGQFTVRCVLTVGEKHLLEIERNRLQADFNNPTDGLAGLAITLSNLRVRVVDGPEWWKQSAGGFTLKDENVLVALYEKTMEAEQIWRQKLVEKAKQAEANAPKPAETPQQTNKL